MESKSINKNVAQINQLIDAERMLENNKKLVLFDVAHEIESLFKKYPCSVIRARKTYFHRSLALAFKKDSEFVNLINHQLHHYMESGVIANMELFKREANGKITCPIEPCQSIGYDIVISAFLVLGLGVALAVIHLTVEMWLINIT